MRKIRWEMRFFYDAWYSFRLFDYSATQFRVRGTESTSVRRVVSGDKVHLPPLPDIVLAGTLGNHPRVRSGLECLSLAAERLQALRMGWEDSVLDTGLPKGRAGTLNKYSQLRRVIEACWQVPTSLDEPCPCLPRGRISPTERFACFTEELTNRWKFDKLSNNFFFQILVLD